MRTRRNMAGIAVLLAFQGWMYLVAGMMSPSEVVAQDADQSAAEVAERVVRARPSEISSIISAAITARPAITDQIVERSVRARPTMADMIVAAAVQEQPEEASRITGAAMQGLSGSEASQPESKKDGWHHKKKPPFDKNKRLFDFDPFDFDPDELRENILAATCQFLGKFGLTGKVDFCVSPSI